MNTTNNQSLPVFYKVVSETNPQKFYIVRFWEDGRMACSCPRFAFLPKKEFLCKHCVTVLSGSIDPLSEVETQTLINTYE